MHSTQHIVIAQALLWAQGRNNLYPERAHTLANESEQIIIMKNSVGKKESSWMFTEKGMSQTCLEHMKHVVLKVRATESFPSRTVAVREVD